MAIIVLSGLPGSGKSLKMAKVGLDLLWRNLRHYKKTGVVRVLWSNIKFSSWVEALYPVGFIQYWSDPASLVKMRDCDVLWDEIATHLDSTNWQNMSLELKRWLQQHRKRGIDIYGTAQDFAQIDKSMRRLTSELLYMTKLIGSRDKSATRPDVKRPWGLIFIRNLDPIAYDEDKSKQKAKGFRFMFIRSQLCSAFDTTQEISMGKFPPLRHVDRLCEHDECGFHKVVHL